MSPTGRLGQLAYQGERTEPYPENQGSVCQGVGSLKGWGRMWQNWEHDEVIIQEVKLVRADD